MTKTLAHQLADYAGALRFEDLSKEVVHEVKRRVIDSIGCALGAWNEEPCVIARKVASEFSAKNGATIIGTSHKSPPDWAAFATGCCIRYFDYNDTYLSKEPAHPSDNISAALAVAECVGANGRELITAIALAYEVQCRLCDAASIRARGWDHVTYGAFSTALASTKLMKLDSERTRHAVNIARWVGADRYAPDLMSNTRDLLYQAEEYFVKKAGAKPISTIARSVVQNAEDARLIAMNRKQEEDSRQHRSPRRK